MKVRNNYSGLMLIHFYKDKNNATKNRMNKKLKSE